MVLSDLEENSFTVKLISSSCSATLEIFAHMPRDRIDHFFSDLSKLTFPWADSRTWETMEGELAITAKCDPLGHIFLTADMVQRSNPEWRMILDIETEIGALPEMVRECKRFFDSSS